MTATSNLEGFGSLWNQAVGIWLDGGWAMIGIGLIALVMFSVGMHVWLSLRRRGFDQVPEETWREWIEDPTERTGPIGDMLGFVTGGPEQTEEDIALFFEQLRKTEEVPFERDLRVMKVCVSTAPLVGLLGTVTGMLTTFGALAVGSGGDKTMGMIASGISEALITTETGLVIALPGLFFQYQLGRKFQQYKAFLAHLETVCTQTLHRRIGQRHERALRRAALRRIARRLVHAGQRPHGQGHVHHNPHHGPHHPVHHHAQLHHAGQRAAT